ncbi:unnamed protein product [Trichobilharzia regenti]|nr:unnamed protein product [Trichobilharzia regenti]
MAGLPNSRKLRLEVKNFEFPHNAKTRDQEDCNRAPPVISSTPPTTKNSMPVPDMIQAIIAAFKMALKTSDILASSCSERFAATSPQNGLSADLTPVIQVKDVLLENSEICKFNHHLKDNNNNSIFSFCT